MNAKWLALLVALPLAAAAQTYKWVDANGQVHYSQLPPRSGKYELIGPAPPPAAAPNQESLNQSLAQDAKAAGEREKQEAQRAQLAAQRQEACRAALERIAYLDARTPRRLATTDPATGEVSRMTDEEFQRQRAAEQEKVNRNCD